MDCSMPGFPVHHQLLELAQTHVRRVGDAIQPSHSLSSPSPPTFSLSQHQGLFQWVSSSHQVAKVLEFQLQPNKLIGICIKCLLDWARLDWTASEHWFSNLSLEQAKRDRLSQLNYSQQCTVVLSLPNQQHIFPFQKTVILLMDHYIKVTSPGYVTDSITCNFNTFHWTKLGWC